MRHWNWFYETNPVKIAIQKYKNQPSILRIKQLIKNPKEFYFAPIDVDPITKEIQNLNLKKAISKDGIPVRPKACRH